MQKFVLGAIAGLAFWAAVALGLSSLISYFPDGRRSRKNRSRNPITEREVEEQAGPRGAKVLRSQF